MKTPQWIADLPPKTLLKVTFHGKYFSSTEEMAASAVVDLFERGFYPTTVRT